MDSAEARSFALTFDDASCLPPLREIVRRMTGHDGDQEGAAELVCAELVTNAVEHAVGPRTVHLKRLPGGRLRITVVDGSVDAALSRAGGRGLAMVDRLAPGWYVRRNGVTKAVCATVAVPA